MKFLLRKQSRLRRKICAAWQPVDVGSPDLIQTITDAMAMNAQIQVEYQGSGWRLIQPYGWNSSQEGNVLLMCYKDTGEIRSYRLDRISQVLVDDTLLTDQSGNTIHDDGFFQVQDYSDTRPDPADFEIPLLPNMDEIMEQTENEMGQELPYDAGLDMLTDGLPPEVPEEPMEGEEELPPDDTTNKPTDDVKDVQQDETTDNENEEKLNGK